MTMSSKKASVTTPQKTVYFAYGSNLLFARLKARIPSVNNIGTGKLPCHIMRFTLPGGDGSGKCGIEKAHHDEHVWGVLYELNRTEKPVLDEIENVGFLYQDQMVEVEQDGHFISAFTYFPTDMSCQLQPYDWYKNFVLLGAKENSLPKYYIERIEQIEAKVDPNPQRRKENFAIMGINLETRR